MQKLGDGALTEHRPFESGERVVDWGGLDNGDAFERSI